MLEAFYFTAQILAALAIIGTLAFVGMQIKGHNREQFINRVTERSKLVCSINDSLIENETLRDVLLRSIGGLDVLSANDRLICESFWRKTTQLLIVTFSEAKYGHIDSENQMSGESIVRNMALNPAFRQWWHRYQNHFGSEFCSYMNTALDLPKEENRKTD